MKKDKKTVVLTIIGITALLISVIGAAYAYFKVNTENNFGTPKVDASAAALGSVKLVSTDSNLYLNLTRKDMMYKNRDYYYAVTDPNGSPIGVHSGNNMPEGMSEEEFYFEIYPTIGYIEVTGNGIYDCDYEFEVTYEGNLKEALTENDGVLLQVVMFDGEPDYVSDSNAIQEYNYSVYNTEFPLTISGTLRGLSSLNKTSILADLSLSTFNEQNHLINKNMKLSIKAKSFSCTSSKEIMILNNAAKDVYDLSNDDELWSSGLKGDGYRFIGENPNNYMCFGTFEKDECISNPDEYMYRIIGIFPDENNEGYVKLIKDEPLSVEYMWHSNADVNISWNESDLYNVINGEYFLTSEIYFNNWKNSNYADGTNLFEHHIKNWNYTVTDSSGLDYSGMTSREIYLHESNQSIKSSNEGKWETINAQIGLMYVSDYVLSLGKSSLNSSHVNEVSWLNKNNSEWTMSYNGLESAGRIAPWYIDTDGVINYKSANELAKVRPVFYLNNADNIRIEGTGTENDPFVLDGSYYYM